MNIICVYRWVVFKLNFKLNRGLLAVASEHVEETVSAIDVGTRAAELVIVSFGRFWHAGRSE